MSWSRLVVLCIEPKADYTRLTRFFEARNNPDQAPLVAWFNGGPGASSMQGLFKSHGPCQFYESDTATTEPSLNPYSYNEFANVIYIDQPIGTGFSYGSACCNSTETAAVYVWEFLQVFHAAFPEFEGREFGIFAQVGSLFFTHITAAPVRKTASTNIQYLLSSPTAAATPPSLPRTSFPRTPPSPRAPSPSQRQ